MSFNQDAKNYLLARFMQSKPMGRVYASNMTNYYSDPGQRYYPKKSYRSSRQSSRVPSRQSSRVPSRAQSPTRGVFINENSNSPSSNNSSHPTVIHTRSNSRINSYNSSGRASAALRLSPKYNSKNTYICVDVKEIEKQNNDNKTSTCVFSVLDGKTVRIKNSDNQYLTGYQHSDHINPKYRFTDRLDSDSDQLFHIEHVNGNACVLVSVMKHIGYIKPALFYSPLTKDLQLRDYFPYCPKERKYFVGNSGQGQNG